MVVIGRKGLFRSLLSSRLPSLSKSHFSFTTYHYKTSYIESLRWWFSFSLNLKNLDSEVLIGKRQFLGYNKNFYFSELPM